MVFTESVKVTNERKIRTDFYFYEIESFDEDSVISTD